MFRTRDSTSAMIIFSDSNDDMGIVFTLEGLTQAGIIFIMAIAIIVTNILIIATFLNFRGPSEVINCYLLSLAVADLLCGLLVVPLSVYPAVVREWVYGDIVCRLVGYLEVTLWAVTVYTFMWISVDRYLAVRKPLRYETLQTKTRCQCWMAFTWISAAMLCCPPLLGFNQPVFDKDAYICMLDWGSMAAYSVTLSILVLGPSLITIVYTYTYIFNMLRKLRSGYAFHDKEYATALSENLSNPSHLMSFSLVVAFWVSWTPYIGVKLYEYFTGVKLQVQFLHFGIVWLGFLNSFWKSMILITMSPQFRLALRIFCMTICCRYKGRMQAELIGMEADD
ncbi:probable G-protein coupled receptor 52 isoform X1 [Tribolium castaneum]|uniref:Putative ecdysteroids/dopamine receptor n=1 Tax=Tribolium castaneum TaxID=7070 RepID=D6WWZ1_TRICA|nr:probable G-protein coupled receptor 52 [Tribolium castaneum]XP_968380.1 PREDICTED: probable G-protein coupled receptor 52 isoform X1 [Tribolium castaneum]EFA09248.1 Tachykinin-like peptides receptor 86C [Tribolium castaneum]DAA64512.1 TPA_inf: putative ecdysteroids/dopamine receptor [Tribolium castaneum]|eukprot:NP_001280528.1 probable G-protein coupled receptor 52 [Tribolium castaneum]